MNIEGAEAGVVKGSKKTLRRTRHVRISCHDFLADQSGAPELRTTAEVMELLTQEGFELKRPSRDHRPHIQDCVYGRNPRLAKTPFAGPCRGARGRSRIVEGPKSSTLW